ALVALATAAGERPKRDAQIAHGAALRTAAHALVETLARFGADDLLTGALRGLEDAIGGVQRAAEMEADVPVAALWLAAVESLDAAIRVSSARLELRDHPPLDA